MKVGIPKGLLYYKYKPFFTTFFEELGAEIIESPDTNKEILDLGVKLCTDEACLPIKVFHGHVEKIKDKCDLILVPRIMQVEKREFICPKFCGIPEMIENNIKDLPLITKAPIYSYSADKFINWAYETGKLFTKSYVKIQKAFEDALKEQNNFKEGIDHEGFQYKIALIGHTYNIYDKFINMNLIKKLNGFGIGVITHEVVDDSIKHMEIKKLFKRPFWTFAREYYGFASYAVKNKLIDGIIYLSSFACGIDSVIVELLKLEFEDVPFLLLKIDEHTGEAGFDTRVEAFVDMLTRRKRGNLA
ncbi:acyl-CoA dehydratase activase-related protein [Caloramator australicus]|uniref:Activator of (R)-2-hydroxyglutaryl-CoA dehydratase n=1 Tax=Caloramator australicus RC3 TaxID=857293 RepID=G0V472_9CLOT|nr:acyl-CoA dehydratase activase-related protein [Caloramator australicus]CCC57912.1 Activator of (R)-2-hydroxyglutaryl-CoA dehydratase [Caloramator australicus RC3]